MPVALALLELVVLAEPLEDALVGLVLGQALELAGLVVHPAVGADHGQLREPVVAADLEVGRVVARRDLQRAGAEVELDALVGDHRDAALDHGDDRPPSDQVAVAHVVGVHGDGDVGEDRRGAGGRDRECPSPSASG